MSSDGDNEKEQRGRDSNRKRVASPLIHLAHVPHDLIRRFKGDLKAAGIAYADAGGRIADFHSLRKCGATLLAQQGVHPRIAQQMLRHSSVELTMGVIPTPRCCRWAKR